MIASENNFKNKTVLISGASRGVGRATAIHFAKLGARVIVHYNNNHLKAEKTLNELDAGSHLIKKCDIKDPEAIREMVEEIIEQTGKIDVLVNNAGIYEEIDIKTIDYKGWQDHWNDNIQTNLLGAANLSFFVIKNMIKSGGGKIINVSSRGAFRGEPTSPAYGASKAGMNSMGQSMAKALAKAQIYVYNVAPGYVETDMVTEIMASEAGEEVKAQSPLNRISKPEEIANLIVFLASEGTEYMTGGIIDINGASYLRS
ncbi:MAG: SDR family oxidoreductase [Bacteroidales bacterium]|nr:SDR family oxidoreductase [Bacteroidales bacterium]